MRRSLLLAGLFALVAAGLATRSLRASRLETQPGRRVASPAWARCGPTIAHAMGAVDGRSYTNSREAFDHAFTRGFRVMEVDLGLTADSAVLPVARRLARGADARYFSCMDAYGIAFTAAITPHGWLVLLLYFVLPAALWTWLVMRTASWLRRRMRDHAADSLPTV